jgi:hypothetical protein
MASWILYLGVLTSVHVAVLLGLPRAELIQLGARVGLGPVELTLLAAVASLTALRLFAKSMHHRGWEEGYFSGHVDGLSDADDADLRDQG